MRLANIIAMVFMLIPPTLSGQQPVRTSMIELLANPGRFDGKTIEVKGYLRLEFEGNALYLHKEDFDQALSENAVWVNIDKLSTEKRKVVSDTYVLLVGRFDVRQHGQMGIFGGEIGSITRLEPWPSRSGFERMHAPLKQ